MIWGSKEVPYFMTVPPISRPRPLLVSPIAPLAINLSDSLPTQLAGSISKFWGS